MERLVTMANGIAISWTVLFILNFIGIVVSVDSSQCSLFCMCDVWYGLQRASCTGRHLYSIDTGAPNTVQALDLSDNVISVLHSFELAVIIKFLFKKSPINNISFIH